MEELLKDITFTEFTKGGFRANNEKFSLIAI